VKIPGGSSYLKRILYTLEGSRIPVADCGPGEEFLFIDEYGTASPCSFTGNEYGVSIRDLSDVSAIAELPERFRKLRRERTAAACCDCPSTQVSGKYEDVAAC
jgi:MoaA/NifB/PqqE/SkfB family radical SAM enzyme